MKPSPSLITLRQIRYFIAVAEVGSVVVAARQIPISSSSITEAIKTLESHLETRLFLRKAGGMQLTHHGHQFLRYAYDVIDTVSRAEQSVRRKSVNIVGDLSIGVTPLVAGYYLADLLVRFQRAYPKIRVKVIEDSRSYIEHLLVNGEIDTGVMIVSNLENTQALNQEVLETSNYRIWIHPDHQLQQNSRVSPADLLPEKLILLKMDELEKATSLFWEGPGGHPNIVFRSTSVEAVRSLVATGFGIAFLPDVAYRPWSLEGDRIDVRALDKPSSVLSVGMAWRRGSPLAVTAQNFLAVAREHKRPQSR